jgi:hypothetical protein
LGARVVSTYASYKLITRDIDKAISRVEKQPTVKRETEYFLANIGKVKSVDEFVSNTRLFNYAMKAFNLEDMTYAKAFMKKALNEGLSDPNSFANRLNDKRYAEFVKAFNFAEYGENATSYVVARDDTVKAFTARVTANGVLPLTEAAKAETAYFQENIGKVESVDDLLNDSRLLLFALRAFEIENVPFSRAELSSILSGGVSDPDSPANKHSNENVKKLAMAFDFASLGEKTTTYVAAQDLAIAKYARQTLEVNAGQENEGVRLALYFQRKAPEIKNFYAILADTALAEVVRTALGLPDSVARADVDQQVKMLEKKFDIEDFQDPKKVEKFLARFTAMWELENPTVSPQTLTLNLFSNSTSAGISADTLLAIATLKR